MWPSICTTKKIRGFVDVGAITENDTLSFNLGEFDLFITSELSDNISFLSETVFKYDSTLEEFKVSIERVIINYNYWVSHLVAVSFDTVIQLVTMCFSLKICKHTDRIF